MNPSNPSTQKVWESCRKAAEAEAEAAKLTAEAVARLDQAEALVSEMQGNAVKLTLADLHRLADAQLKVWCDSCRPESFQVGVLLHRGVFAFLQPRVMVAS
jgi:hypothetical protein